MYLCKRELAGCSTKPVCISFLRTTRGLIRPHTNHPPAQVIGSAFGAHRCERAGARQLCCRPVAASDGTERGQSVMCNASTSGVQTEAEVITGYWQWQGYKIRYQQCGTEGPAVLLLHGFGANCDHWRKNLPVLGQSYRAYAIDLLGYGYSDKPNPRSQSPNTLYTFETWADQALDFMKEVVGGPAVCCCNSVGGLVGLQAALQDPKAVPAVMVINISLRMLHETKQTYFQRPIVKFIQETLRDTALGPMFFSSVAKPQTVKNILSQCYGDAATVTDELVDVILKPGLQAGAVDVFLDFISYSGGPTPEQLMQDVKVPVSVVWGELDPWEKLEWGVKFKEFTNVEDFISLPGVGHCPQDEAPHLVNPIIASFVSRHAHKLSA